MDTLIQLPLQQIHSHPPSAPEFFCTSTLHSSRPPFLSIVSPLGLLLWGNRAWLFFRTNGMNSITWNMCPVLSDNTPWGVFLSIPCFENLKDVNPRWGLSRVLGFTKVLSFVALSKHRLPTVFLCTCLSFIPPVFPLLLFTYLDHSAIYSALLQALCKATSPTPLAPSRVSRTGFTHSGGLKKKVLFMGDLSYPTVSLAFHPGINLLTSFFCSIVKINRFHSG